jgi:hypothetical protein
MIVALFYFLIPFYHELTFPYYVMFSFYILHRFLPLRSNDVKHKMLQILGITSIYSYYTFHNIYISYILSCLALYEFAYYEEMFVFHLIFLYTSIQMMSFGKIFLFPPFVGNCYFLSKTSCKNTLTFMERTIWDLCQFSFFWYSSKFIDFRENFQC